MIAEAWASKIMNDHKEVFIYVVARKRQRELNRIDINSTVDIGTAREH